MTLTTLDVFLGGYVPGTSVLHRLDPRTKLLGLILMLIGVFLGHSTGGAVAQRKRCPHVGDRQPRGMENMDRGFIPLQVDARHDCRSQSVRRTRAHAYRGG